MPRISYKILTPKDISSHQRQLLDLYDPERKRARKYSLSLRNSAFVIVAICDGRIIGAFRIITDGYMCAMLIDLLVQSECRGRGIGSALVRKATGLCSRKGIKNISLVADPSDPGLVPFYSDLGFEYSPDNGVYMQFKD